MEPFPVGTLKGSLKAILTVTPPVGDPLVGTAKLRIRSTELETTYMCISGIDGSGDPIPELIQTCRDAEGPQSFIVDLTGFPVGPVLVAAELHVLDKGTFKVSNESAKIRGKIAVKIDSAPAGDPQGTISITKGKASFAIE